MIEEAEQVLSSLLENPSTSKDAKKLKGETYLGTAKKVYACFKASVLSQMKSN